jgi:DNA repair protein RadA
MKLTKSTSEQPSKIDLKSGLQILNERMSMHRLTSGSADLDSLLGGGIEPNCFYLFYGDSESGVDLLIHQLLVNSLLPPAKYGFGGKCIYSNCGNYREERTIFDVPLLNFLIKTVGLDPMPALDNIYVICAFSGEQQERAVEEIRRTLERDKEIKLVVVHNIAKLFTSDQEKPDKDKRERIKKLQKVVGQLWQTCAENNVALVASCRPIENSREHIPRPEGGNYLLHKANVIVYLRKKHKGTREISAFLRKHPNRQNRNVKFQFEIGGEEMGRVTLPFRMVMQEEMNTLKRTFREVLMDPSRRDAFDSLIKVWSNEQGAMSHARVPTALDIMLLTGVIDNRKLIEELSDRFEILESKITKMISKLEKFVFPVVQQT